jgi:hypothetical protein
MGALKTLRFIPANTIIAGAMVSAKKGFILVIIAPIIA